MDIEEEINLEKKRQDIKLVGYGIVDTYNNNNM